MSSFSHFSSSIFLLHSQLLYLPNPKQHTRDGEWGLWSFQNTYPYHCFLLKFSSFFLMVLFHGLQSSRNKLPWRRSPWATIPSWNPPAAWTHLPAPAEALYRLQLGLPQGNRVLHWSLLCGLCRIVQFPSLRIFRVSHICLISLSCCCTALFTLP